ncbi:deoxyribonuclease V [Candidatus Poribacteria bacterium]|nr:deoxyribonuclease V [Candidatus Poribacteria bacterium]
MEYKSLHSWDISYDEAVEIQRGLKSNIEIKSLKKYPDIIAGADVSYSRGSNIFYASVLIFDMSSLDILEEANGVGKVNFPYIPGLLSFREVPVLIKAFEKIKRVPDVAMFDGHGISHPRGVGLASHLGLMLDIPTIGCAKKKLVGDHKPLGDEVGDRVPIVYQDENVGAVVKTKKNVKPVYVSPGHKMDIDSAVDIVLKTCRGYKLPEPTRQAHLSVNRFRTSSDQKELFDD